MPLFSKQTEKEIEPQILNIKESADFIASYMVEAANPEWIDLFESAKSGLKSDYNKCLDIIADILVAQKITVIDYDNYEAARKIFSYCYGLKELDDYINDEDIDEIRITPNGKVRIVRQGQTQGTELYYSDLEVATLINRLKPIADVGVSLDEGNPTMELVRPDGLRLSALCKPVTQGYCFALRKHGNFSLSLETFISRETLDQKVGELLKLIVKGRRNILICGGTNSGKTTLLKWLAMQLAPYLSICVLETDNELRLANQCPEREIWELEAHPERDADMEKLFEKVLRITPNVILIPEFRGKGEVWAAIEACTRGHDGSMATAHFSSFASPEEAIRNTAMLAIQEKNNIPIELVIERVARRFKLLYKRIGMP